MPTGRPWLGSRCAGPLPRLPCHVYPDGATVEVDDNDLEPDVVLRSGEPLSGDAVTEPDPLVVAGVLSPSTRSDDLTRKLVDCFRLSSIRHYLVFWADRPQLIHHRRRDDCEGIETGVMTTGQIGLAPPGMTIRVGGVHAA